MKLVFNFAFIFIDFIDFLSKNVSPKSEDINSKSQGQQTFQDEVFRVDLKRFHNLMKEQKEEKKEKVFGNR